MSVAEVVRARVVVVAVDRLLVEAADGGVATIRRTHIVVIAIDGASTAHPVRAGVVLGAGIAVVAGRGIQHIVTNAIDAEVVGAWVVVVTRTTAGVGVIGSTTLVVEGMHASSVYARVVGA